MDKVTQVNIEGHNYGFVAGQAVKGSCASAAADWVKTIVLPEGVTLVEGMVVATLFLNTNSAGFSDSITIYSSSGNVYYYDPEMTQVVDLPPYEDCYVITHIEGTAYKYEAYPVAVINGVRVPICDSRGKPCGGPIWSGGDTIASLYLDDKLLMLHSTTINTLQEGSTLPVTSGAVKTACEDLYSTLHTELDPVNSVSSGETKAPTGDAVYNALVNKAGGNGYVYHRYITPRQLNTDSTMKSIIASYPIGAIVICQIGWEEYTSFSHAGAMGYFIISGGSGYAYGHFREYAGSNYTFAFRCIDSSNNYSGLYAI